MFLVSYVALWMLFVILFVAVYLLYRHFGRQLLEKKAADDAQGPVVNEMVRVSLETIDGKRIDVGPEVERAFVIAFTAPRCPGCRMIQPLLRDAAMDGRDIVVVYHGDVQSTRTYVEGMPASVRAVSDPGRELSRMWRVRVTPFFVVTDSNGMVRRKGSGVSLQQVGSLIAGG
jgi:thiol-disulfide isomerase/thioredoxin